jgi:hypothetical protein
MRAELLTSPKVVRMASALKTDRFKTIGGLLAVWCLFDAHSEDGRLDGYTPGALDQSIGWRGFAQAMQSVDWLQVDSGGLFVPRFDEHNGQSAKRRAQEAERKRTQRGQASASGADKKRDQRREEKEKRTTSEPIGSAAAPKVVDPVKDEIWKSGLALMEAQGHARESVRSLFGKLCKDYGQVLVLEAVQDAVRMAPAEAKAWLTARCQERRAQSGNKSAAIEQRNRAAVDIALEEAKHG